MTKAQRNKRLKEVVAKLEELREEIDEIRGELQDDFDNKSERWQEGEKGEAAQTTIDELQQCYDDIDSSATTLNDIVEAE